MTDLKTGDVVLLPQGLKCFHNTIKEITELKADIYAVIEVTREILPMSATGADSHFEGAFVIKARQLETVSGNYSPEGALLTIATRGDFRSEYLLPLENQRVIRRMMKTFVAPQ